MGGLETEIARMDIDDNVPGGEKADLLSSLFGATQDEIGIPDYYRVVRKIGEGASTVIISAFHLTTREHVAIKIVDKMSMTARKVSRASREAKILERLSHPHVVRLIETCENDRFLLIITECYSEGDLHQYLCQQRDFRLSERDARDKFRHLASALEYVHDQGFAHRDVKPENIFVSVRGDAVLGDFGLATQYDPDQPITSSVGTLYYAAPELVIKDANYIGPDVDAWALGVTFYALLSGRLPFAAPTADATRELICAGQLDTIDCVSAVAMDVLRRLLCIDPIRRATMKEIMQHPFVAGVAPLHSVTLNETSSSDLLDRTDDTSVASASEDRDSKGGGEKKKKKTKKSHDDDSSSEGSRKESATMLNYYSGHIQSYNRAAAEMFGEDDKRGRGTPADAKKKDKKAGKDEKKKSKSSSNSNSSSNKVVTVQGKTGSTSPERDDKERERREKISSAAAAPGRRGGDVAPLSTSANAKGGVMSKLLFRRDATMLSEMDDLNAPPPAKHPAAKAAASPAQQSGSGLLTSDDIAQKAGKEKAKKKGSSMLAVGEPVKEVKEEKKKKAAKEEKGAKNARDEKLRSEKSVTGSSNEKSGKKSKRK